MGLLSAVPLLPRGLKYPEFAPLPSAAFRIDAQVKTRYTPDVHKLEQKEAWLLFAYDRYWSELKDYDIYVYTEQRFKMWVQDLGMYQVYLPFNVPEKYRDTLERPEWADPNPLNTRIALAARLRGTLHLIRPETIISLDKDVQNTVRFERVRVPLLYPYKRGHRKVIKNVYREKDGKPYLEKQMGDWTYDRAVGKLEAWMYVAVEKHWSSMMEADSLRNMFKPALISRPHPKKDDAQVGTFYTNERRIVK
jgi:hypothetical protein